jgi:hypothetical protein
MAFLPTETHGGTGQSSFAGVRVGNGFDLAANAASTVTACRGGPRRHPLMPAGRSAGRGNHGTVIVAPLTFAPARSSVKEHALKLTLPAAPSFHSGCVEVIVGGVGDPDF